MRAYNETWIKNREVVTQAERWCRRGLLTTEQVTSVRTAYPVGFQSINGFLEIGLFIFTLLATGGVFLLFAELLPINENSAFGWYCIAFGIGLGVVNNVLIRRRRFYRNGVDNALVVATTALIVGGFNSQFLANSPFWQWCLVALPILLAVVWYYGDTLVTFITLVTLFAFAFDLTLELSFGRTILPFVLMTLAGLLYLWSKRTTQQPYYADAINLAQWIALAVLVASGNYFVVREVNGLLIRSTLIGVGIRQAPEIGLSWLFWLLTFGIPALYLWQGFTKKNRMLIILGGLGVAAVVATVRYYVGIIPLNVHLTLCGLALIGIAVLGIRYLQARPRNGFTDVPDEDSSDEILINTETLTAAQIAGGIHSNNEAHRDDVKFGGGDFGGGGAGAKY